MCLCLSGQCVLAVGLMICFVVFVGAGSWVKSRGETSQQSSFSPSSPLTRKFDYLSVLLTHQSDLKETASTKNNLTNVLLLVRRKCI